MISTKEIQEIAQKITKKKNGSTKLVFKNKFFFQELAQKSPLLSRSFQEGNTIEELGIPALVSHEKNTIFLSKEMLARILKDESAATQKKFIEAIIHHEMLHLRYTSQLKKHTFESLLDAEDKVGKIFKKKYPKLDILVQRVNKKYLSSF